MKTLASLKERYTEVKERIAHAAAKAGQDPRRVVLVAVTKTAEPDQIRDLIRLGHTDFGENRVQQLIQRALLIDEWMARHKTLPGVSWPAPRKGAKEGKQPSAAEIVRWHMIGHLQRNKARKVVEVCRLIHSVDSLRLAEELQQIAAKREKPVEVLLQVNCSGEKSKFGCAIAAAPHLAAQIDTMIQVRLRGLMTMAPYSANPEDSRDTFARAKELFDEMSDDGLGGQHFNILSMGMSGDYEVAIQEGANMVRVGTAIFGEGKPQDDIDEED